MDRTHPGQADGPEAVIEEKAQPEHKGIVPGQCCPAGSISQAHRTPDPLSGAQRHLQPGIDFQALNNGCSRFAARLAGIDLWHEAAGKVDLEDPDGGAEGVESPE